MREGDKRCQNFLGAPSGAQNSLKPLIYHCFLIIFWLFFWKFGREAAERFFFLICFLKNTILKNVFFFENRQNLKNTTVVQVYEIVY